MWLLVSIYILRHAKRACYKATGYYLQATGHKTQATRLQNTCYVLQATSYKLRGRGKMEYRKQMLRLAEILFGRLEDQRTYVQGEAAAVAEQLRLALNDAYSEAYTEVEETQDLMKCLNTEYQNERARERREKEVEKLKAVLNSTNPQEFRGIDSSMPVTVTPPPVLCDFCTKEKIEGVCIKCSGIYRINPNLNKILCYMERCQSFARYAFNATLENGEQGAYLKYCKRHTQEHLRQEVLEEAARNSSHQADNGQKNCICNPPSSAYFGVCDNCGLKTY